MKVITEQKRNKPQEMVNRFLRGMRERAVVSRFRPVILAGIFLALVVGCGGFCGGVTGAMNALILFSVLVGCLYFLGDRMILYVHRAQRLTEEEAPEIFEIIRELCLKLNLPEPDLYLLPSAAANVFSVGRSPQHSAIAITYGALKVLNSKEMEGVFAHELSHIMSHDILITTIVAAITGLPGMIAAMLPRSADWGSGERYERGETHPVVFFLTLLWIPVAAVLVRGFIPRRREYKADRQGGTWCGNPLYLASALRKLGPESEKFPLRSAEPATAHLFIVYPLSGQRWTSFFRTHPPVEARIARLEAQYRDSRRRDERLCSSQPPHLWPEGATDCP